MVEDHPNPYQLQQSWITRFYQGAIIISNQRRLGLHAVCTQVFICLGQLLTIELLHMFIYNYFDNEILGFAIFDLFFV